MDPIKADIIKPSAEEARDGHRRLQECWPIWKRTCGLLVSSDGERGLVVSALDYGHDDMGFALRLAVLENLVAPPDFVDKERTVSCVWNQPYLSFSAQGISAPYCFYLHFDEAGVDRARKLREVFARLAIELPGGARMLRRCFGPDGPEYAASFQRLLEH